MEFLDRIYVCYNLLIDDDFLWKNLICSGYALGEIEGMSKVLVVISNLDETEEYRKSFSKYSLL